MSRGRQEAYFYFRATNPTYGGQLILKQQVIGLVVESPLANNQVGAGVLDLLDHLLEGLGLVLAELLVFFDGFDVQLVLGLGARRLKRAGEDGDFGILDFLGHLRVRHVLINDNSLDQEGIRKGTSNFAFDLDEFEVDVFSFEICNRQDRIHSDLGELIVALRNTTPY